MSRYERIAFTDGDDADEPLQILDDLGVAAAIDYLAEWHDPGEHETSDELGHGTDDNHYFDENSGYHLSWNSRLGYIGLEFDTEFDDD